MAYFSEREWGALARTIEEVTPDAWRGIWAVVTTRVQNGSFGNAFPERCPDGHGIIGHDAGLLEATLLGDGLMWPIEKDVVPKTPAVLDLLEFCYRNVAKPEVDGYHSFFRHNHLSFHAESGRSEFLEAVNRVFGRNGIAFELNNNGEVQRLGPAILASALQKAIFYTGDALLDDLLEVARRKFLDPDLKIRTESLEKLWDAFERLKTLEGGTKKASVSSLLINAIKEPEMRGVAEAELIALTEIGNNFMIRHTEVGKTPITSSEQVDYLFHRMFAVIQMLLRATKRGG
jgi:hypothetical protein